MNKSFFGADLFGLEQQTPRTNGIRGAGGVAFMAAAGMYCASWGRYDLPDLHSPPGCDAVGLMAGDRLPRGAGAVPWLQ